MIDDNSSGGGSSSSYSNTEDIDRRLEINVSDFCFGCTLGEGAYARVVHAKSKHSLDEYAVKIMEKVHIKKENKIKAVMMERQILSLVSHPFIIKFFFSFQDAGYLYMCMDLAPGGELLGLITANLNEKLNAGVENQACSYDMTKFYIAEIVEGLEYLHEKSIIHRDMKPENILLGRTGHIKITDFGTSTIIDSENPDSPRTSFVGTPDYVSPEVLSGERKATKACDLWAVGCILYQMLTGASPFRADTEYLTFEIIMNHCKGSSPLRYPPVIDAPARDLILSLLRPVDSDRLGAGSDEQLNGYGALRAHSFFNGIEWGRLEYLTAPYIPDTSTFPVSDNMRDGSTNEWLLEGEATPIMNKARFSAIGSGSSNSRSKRTKSVFNKFLQEREQTEFDSTVYKRVGLFSKKRQLILTNTPRLLYVDPHSMELKGEIPWTKEHPVSVSVKSSKEFDILCSLSGRAYHMSDSVVGAKKWEEVISNAIASQLRRSSFIATDGEYNSSENDTRDS